MHCLLVIVNDKTYSYIYNQSKVVVKKLQLIAQGWFSSLEIAQALIFHYCRERKISSNSSSRYSRYCTVKFDLSAPRIHSLRIESTPPAQLSLFLISKQYTHQYQTFNIFASPSIVRSHSLRRSNYSSQKILSAVYSAYTSPQNDIHCNSPSRHCNRMQYAMR